MTTTADMIPWKMPATTSTDWQATWPELQCKQIDPIQVVADLYLTEGLMVHGFVNKFDKPEPVQFLDTMRIAQIVAELGLTEKHAAIRQERIAARFANDPLQQMVMIAEQARAYQVALVESVFPTFWAYTQAACGGELRHHSAIGAQKLGQVRKNAWVQWREIWETHGESALILMSKLFHEMSGSLGGPKWAAASDLLISYHRGELGKDEFTNKKVFLDRVLSLQHNGGCFLSKRTWLNARTNRNGEKVTCASGNAYEVSSLNTNHQSMVPILDAHAANPPDAKSLYSGAHRTVRAMTYKYMELAESIGITATWGEVKVPGKAWTPDAKLELPQLPTAETLPVPSTTPASTAIAKSPVLAAVPIKEILESGSPFKVVFTINKIRTGFNEIELTTPIVKSYSFKTAEAFLDKNFYTGHMLKSQHPGSKATNMSVQLVQGKKKSNSHEFTGWSIQMKNGHTINYVIDSND